MLTLIFLLKACIMGNYHLSRLTYDSNNKPVIVELQTVKDFDDAQSVISDDLFDIGESVYYTRIIQHNPKTLFLDTGQHDRYYLVEGEDLFDFTNGK